ncbi:nucleoside 2-deoxyribosyltransferase [Nocardia sp. NPDC004068]|uniref:nucleoside 2-deoxyribosyltransferase n=1 Tax=Nocardia sp. NPDC004068 TaxID=3364303 RepID=UPI0036943467
MTTKITLCGSGKMRTEITTAATELRNHGFIVLAPPLHKLDTLFRGQPEESWSLAWKGATFAHLNRIAKADVVFIVNPDGYMGPSTTLELGYAVAMEKYIVGMQPDNAEMARTILLDHIIGTDNVVAACKELADEMAAGHSR